MVLRTDFTRLTHVEHPVVQAPMGGTAGGALAAAVSEGGGLGMIGGGRGDLDWLDREVAILAARTTRPWGIGFLTWAITPAAVHRALEHQPRALMLSFGDPSPYAAVVGDAGVLLIVQVTDLDEARRALDVGADVLVAQGGEAGGHGKGSATLPFVPKIVDLAPQTPVLAAGGIADGRGLAAALALGAAGALLGTRFQACRESLAPPEIIEALLGATGDRTERTSVLDIAARAGWPAAYTARVVRNEFLETWRGREEELTASVGVQDDYQAAARRLDPSVVPVWASEAVDLIADVRSATELVGELAADAERALRTALAGATRRPVS